MEKAKSCENVYFRQHEEGSRLRIRPVTKMFASTHDLTTQRYDPTQSRKDMPLSPNANKTILRSLKLPTQNKWTNAFKRKQGRRPLSNIFSKRKMHEENDECLPKDFWAERRHVSEPRLVCDAPVGEVELDREIKPVTLKNEDPFLPPNETAFYHDNDSSSFGSSSSIDTAGFKGKKLSGINLKMLKPRGKSPFKTIKKRFFKQKEHFSDPNYLSPSQSYDNILIQNSYPTLPDFQAGSADKGSFINENRINKRRISRSEDNLMSYLLASSLKSSPKSFEECDTLISDNYLNLSLTENEAASPHFSTPYKTKSFSKSVNNRVGSRGIVSASGFNEAAPMLHHELKPRYGEIPSGSKGLLAESTFKTSNQGSSYDSALEPEPKEAKYGLLQTLSHLGPLPLTPPPPKPPRCYKTASQPAKFEETEENFLLSSEFRRFSVVDSECEFVSYNQSREITEARVFSNSKSSIGVNNPLTVVGDNKRRNYRRLYSCDASRKEILPTFSLTKSPSFEDSLEVQKKKQNSVCLSSKGASRVANYSRSLSADNAGSISDTSSHYGRTCKGKIKSQHKSVKFNPQIYCYSKSVENLNRNPIWIEKIQLKKIKSESDLRLSVNRNYGQSMASPLFKDSPTNYQPPSSTSPKEKSVLNTFFERLLEKEKQGRAELKDKDLKDEPSHSNYRRKVYPCPNRFDFPIISQDNQSLVLNSAEHRDLKTPCRKAEDRNHSHTRSLYQVVVSHELGLELYWPLVRSRSAPNTSERRETSEVLSRNYSMDLLTKSEHRVRTPNRY